MMATAFLGFYCSPIWYSVNVKIFILILFNYFLYFFLYYRIKIGIYKKYLFNIMNTSKYSSCPSGPNRDKNNKSDKLRQILVRLSLKPIVVFYDLHLKETRDDIRKSLKDKAGIYMIVNLTNEKFYVGSAMKNRLYIRFTNHLIYFTGSDIIALPT